MSRGVGAIEQLQSLLPEWAAPVVALLTQLGDVWFLVVLLAVCYWLEPRGRDEVVALVGTWLAGLGCYLGLKAVFGLPRPDRPFLDPALLPRVVRPVYEATAFASGYGFPSGHATSSTIVYVGLAGALTLGSRRLRYAAAAAIVTVVSLSRVALGVHFLVDVVAGVALGLGVLGLASALTTSVPRRTSVDGAAVAFALAVGFAAFFVVASGAHPESLLVLAASVGTFAGWRWLERSR